MCKPPFFFATPTLKTASNRAEPVSLFISTQLLDAVSKFLDTDIDVFPNICINIAGEALSDCWGFVAVPGYRKRALNCAETAEIITVILEALAKKFHLTESFTVPKGFEIVEV